MPKPPAPAEPASRLTLRLVLGRAGALGPGKMRLLELVGEHGSISAAGRAMGMSYKRAWNLVDELNRTFRRPLVTAQQGGRAGGGASLTGFGREVLARYRRIEGAALAEAEAHFAALAGELAEPEAAEG